MLFRAIQDSALVRNALRDELDLILVDEFRDPLQLALFVELAKLSKASVRVGAQTQAIYGFRGTDSALIQETLAPVVAWGGIEKPAPSPANPRSRHRPPLRGTRWGTPN